MTKRVGSLTTILLLVACGGGEQADQTPQSGPAAAAPAAPAAPTMPARPTGALTTPDWYHVDNGARTVHMTVVAGLTPDNNHWNFNGQVRGASEIVVPEGYTVTIDFENRDPLMAHSLGIQADFTNPMVPPVPDPAFEGAVTPNPGSLTEGTLSGETDTIQFVADTAGQYAMVCYVPGHTAVGMWLYFAVSGSGEAGVRGA